MDDLLPLVAILAGLFGLTAGLVGVMVRARRRGITGVLAIADELYQPRRTGRRWRSTNRSSAATPTPPMAADDRSIVD